MMLLNAYTARAITAIAMPVIFLVAADSKNDFPKTSIRIYVAKIAWPPKIPPQIPTKKNRRNPRYFLKEEISEIFLFREKRPDPFKRITANTKRIRTPVSFFNNSEERLIMILAPINDPTTAQTAALMPRG